MKLFSLSRIVFAVTAGVSLLLVSVAGVAQEREQPTEFRLGVTAGEVSKLRLGLGQVQLDLPENQFQRSSDVERLSAAEVRRVLREDLKFSGYFSVLDLAGTGNAGSIEVPPDIPEGVGTVAARITAGLSMDSAIDQVTLTGYLFEGDRDNVIVGKKYQGQPEVIRRMAHLFADEIVRQLSGEEGIAQTQIAFVSNQSGNKELFVMDYDGHHVTQLTGHDSVVLSPSFSPDGTEITFVSYARNRPEIYLFNRETGRSTLLLGGSELHSAPSFSPSGDKIAFARSVSDDEAEIFIMDRGGEEIQRLTRRRGIDTSPEFSPNGREIVFVSSRSGSPQLWIMDTEGLNVRRLTFDGFYNTSPTWSPAGDQIAFSCRVDGRFQICSVAPDGSDFKQLTRGAGNKEDPSFSPDGRHLAFSTSASGNYQVALMHRDGSGARVVTSGDSDHTFPAWSP